MAIAGKNQYIFDTLRDLVISRNIWINLFATDRLEVQDSAGCNIIKK